MQSPLTDRQAVEVFHLLFLRALTAGPSRDLVVVKGGCNLRFFFGSIRYSEDLDVDVIAGASGTLRKNVDRALASTAMTSPLSARGIRVGEVSAPKQTETVQRWKIALTLEGRARGPNTKIEFSRRPVKSGTARDGIRADGVDGSLLRSYQLPQTVVGHYDMTMAARQKVEALAGRTVPQARDVFDLAWLVQRGANATWLDPARAVAPAALERALGISYDEYAAQVVAYLDANEQAHYAGKASWDQLQTTVVELLDEVAR